MSDVSVRHLAKVSLAALIIIVAAVALCSARPRRCPSRVLIGLTRGRWGWLRTDLAGGSAAAPHEVTNCAIGFTHCIAQLGNEVLACFLV